MWADCPVLEFIHDPGRGFYWCDDFMNTDHAGSTAEVNGWDLVGDAGAGTNANEAAVTAQSTKTGGVGQLSTDSDDNDEIYMCANQNLGGQVQIKKNYRMWYEARIQLGNITTSSFFIGLAAESVAANFMADTQTDAAIWETSDPTAIGFMIAGDTDPNGLDFVYHDAGTGPHTQGGSLGDVTTTPYYRLGLYFDGKEKVECWMDGVKKFTVDPDASGFPDQDLMGCVFAIKNFSGTASTLNIDWVRCAMDRE